MKLLIIVGLTCVLMAQASPFNDLGVRNLGVGNDYGRQYGNQQHESGNRGYQNEGHQRGGSSHGHDRGFEDHDVTQITRAHHSSGHDAGGGNNYQEGGHRAGANNQYQGGQSNYGHEHNRGMGLY